MQALLHHLLEESSPEQLGLLLLLIREAFQASQLRAGGYRVRRPPSLLPPCLGFKGQLSHFQQPPDKNV